MHWNKAGILLMAVSLLCGCQSTDCDPSEQLSDRNANQQSSALAKKIAHGFPDFVSKRAQAQWLREDDAERAKVQEERRNAEAAYKAAKERRERAKPVPRAQLRIPEHLIAILPPIRHNSLIAEYYNVENAPRKPLFIDNGHLTFLASALLEVLARVDEHALSADEFGVDKLNSAAETLQKMADISSSFGHLNTFEVRAISEALGRDIHTANGAISADSFASKSESEQMEIAFEWLCSMENSPVPRAAAQCQRAIERSRDISRFEDALEFALADAWMNYAEQMKYGNLEKVSDAEREKYANEDNPNEIHPKYHTVMIETRLAGAFEEFAGITDKAAALSWFEGLIPQHEQYHRLQALRERYRKIVGDGGWAVVPPDRMFAGGHAPLVKNLKQRLAAEGYYKGEIDDAFDAGLTQAIKSYQKHHQLEENGEVGDVFWRSLNVSADQRLAEIEVNIRRWHKTLFEASDTYIYINIPSFSVEFWADGEHKSTHRAVVGSSTKICNTRTQEWELMNSTRLMHSRMTYLVYNPYWNVPPRIEVDEFWPKINADPKWLATTDYEYFTPKGGGRVLRQKPGENNALGRVKLIFPNRYNIYLHDTPKQGMFNYPVRAFSHGCIRVEGATKFAKAILEHDGQWDKKMVDRFLKSQTEHPIDLKTPIDVFIEYHTVTVDDDGEPYFLADIYKIIKNEISPPTALERRCNPATDRTSSYRSGAGEDSGP